MQIVDPDEIHPAKIKFKNTCFDEFKLSSSTILYLNFLSSETNLTHQLHIAHRHQPFMQEVCGTFSTRTKTYQGTRST